MAGHPCKVCGSKDVNLVDGFYYCVECGTQDINLQETIVNATVLADGTYAKTRKRRIPKAIKTQMSGEWHKWHAFNFIICGMADELLELGAKPTFKTKLLWIWTRYIKKYYKKDDYETTSASKRNTTLLCEEKAAGSDDDDNDDDDENADDVENVDDEDKKNEKSDPSSTDAMSDISVFKIRVMHAMLYAALNLDNSDIQLSDLKRFLREGRLSLNDCVKYIPEELNVKLIPQYVAFITSYRLGICRTSILQTCFSLFKELDLGTPNVPNLSDLVTRYCKELCLPKEFRELVLSLMEMFPPETSLGRYMRYYKSLPDFDMSVMAYIVVALKICFGLDDVYDAKITKIVDEINYEQFHLKSFRVGFSEETQRLFSFGDWLKYLECRKLILCNYYQPMATHYRLNVGNSSYSEVLKCSLVKHKRKCDVIAHNILSKMAVNEANVIRKEEFPSSLTPLTAYTEFLLRKTNDDELRVVLSEDFAKYDLKYACRDFYLTPDSLTENCVTGVDETKKVLKDLSSGTLRYYEMRVNHINVFLKDVETDKWLKQFEKPKDAIDSDDDEDDDFEEKQSKGLDDKVTDSLEEVTDNDDIFGETNKVEDSHISYDQSHYDINHPVDDLYDDTNINNNNVMDNLTDNKELETISLNATNVFDSHHFDKEEVVKYLVLKACKKYKLPVPFMYKENRVYQPQATKQSQKKDGEAVEVKPRAIFPNGKSTADILALYNLKLQESINSMENYILNAPEPDIAIDEKSPANVDMDVDEPDVTENGEVDLVKDISMSDDMNESKMDTYQDINQTKTENVEKELTDEEYLNDNSVNITEGGSSDCAETKASYKKKKIYERPKIPLAIDPNADVDTSNYPKLCKSDIKEFNYACKHYLSNLFLNYINRRLGFDNEMMECLPKSYRYILRTCSEIIEVGPFQLCGVLQKLEYTIMKSVKLV